MARASDVSIMWRSIASLRPHRAVRSVAAIVVVAATGAIIYGATISPTADQDKEGQTRGSASMVANEEGSDRHLAPNDVANAPKERSGGHPTPTEFANAPPEPLRPETYREVGTAMSQSRETVRLFTGTLKEDSKICFGLRTSEVIGMACGVDLTGSTPLQVSETTYRGHRMISGLVSAYVASVLIVSNRGGDIQVPVRNRFFFFDGKSGDAVEAYDGSGK